MTWSLRIFNGDLIKGLNNSLDTVRGSEKVVQDLICWIKEPIGSDPLNPDLGSFIDQGGEGETYLVRNEAVSLPSNYSDLVISEITRLIKDYQRKQSVNIENEMSQFGRIVTFQPDEIINDFKINYVQNYDTLYVSVNLKSVSGEYMFNIPVKSEAVIRGI